MTQPAQVVAARVEQRLFSEERPGLNDLEAQSTLPGGQAPLPTPTFPLFIVHEHPSPILSALLPGGCFRAPGGLRRKSGSVGWWERAAGR